MAMGLIWLGNSVRSRVVDIVGKKMEQGGAQAVSYARDLVPVKTGQLQASISYHWNRAEMRLVLTADRPYAAFVEFGTGRMAARPYLRPAIEQVAKAFGLTTVEAAFPNTPGKYQAGYRRLVSHHKKNRVIIGRRS